MGNPIEAALATGATLYAIIHNPNGEIWNDDDEVFEAFNPSHWANYAVPLAEQGTSGYYRATYPAGIIGVLTTEVVYNQADVSPVITDGPAVGIGQSQGVNLRTINDDAQSVDNLKASLNTMVRGSAVSGTLSTTQMTTDLGSVVNNAYNGRILIFTSGDLADEAASITGYNGLTKTLTFTGITSAPSDGDTFIIC